MITTAFMAPPCPLGSFRASQVVLVVKDPPANAGDMGSMPGGEETLEEEMATHSTILAKVVNQNENRPVLLNLECAYGLSEDLVKMQIIIQQVWGWACV